MKAQKNWMVVQQWSVSLQQLDPTSQLDKSFQVFGDGIHSSGNAVANSYRSSSEKLMSLEWGQTIIFLLTPLFFMLLFIETDEDDDGPPDGGIMTPVYAPSPSWQVK